MKKILVIFLTGLFLVSFVSAEIQVGTSGDIGVDLNIPTPINYSLVNVNNSEYFDGYTPTTLRDWFDTLYCELTGCTMEGNLDMDGNYILGVGELTVDIIDVYNLTAENIYTYGNINTTGNITASNFFGNWNGSSAYVPYTGATGDVNLETHNLFTHNFNISDDLENVFIGYLAGDNSSTTKSTLIGKQAGHDSTNSNMVAIGYKSGSYNDGLYQIAIGEGSGTYNTGNYQQVFGTGRAGENNSGLSQIAIGAGSGRFNKGGWTIQIGNNAGLSNSGINQVVIGSTAGQLNLGNYSIMIGDYAGYHNTKDDLTCVGSMCGYYNTGTGTITFGTFAGRSNSGDTVATMGYASSRDNSGDRIVGIGYEAGRSNTGNDIVALGYQAGKNNVLDNQFIVQQANINAIPLIQGNFSSGYLGIGTTSPQTNLHVVGDVPNSESPTDADVRSSTYGSTLTMGTNFTPNINGIITKLRIKALATGNYYLANVWHANGTLITSVSIEGIGTSTWAEGNVNVPVTAGNSYVVSYYAKDVTWNYNSGGCPTGDTRGNITINNCLYINSKNFPTTVGTNLYAIDFTFLSNVNGDILTNGIINTTSSVYATTDVCITDGNCLSNVAGLNKENLFGDYNQSFANDVLFVDSTSKNVRIGTTESHYNESFTNILLELYGSGYGAVQALRLTNPSTTGFGSFQMANDAGLKAAFFLMGSENPSYSGANGFSMVSIGGGNLGLGTDDSVDLLIKTGGNVGIGTTNPQNKLNVIGDGNFTGDLYSTEGYFNYLQIDQTVDDSGFIIYGHDDQSAEYLDLSIGVAGNPMINASKSMSIWVGAAARASFGLKNYFYSPLDFSTDGAARIEFGAETDFSLGYNEPSDSFRIVRAADLNATEWIMLDLDKSGNLNVTGNITLLNGGKVWDSATCTYISSPDGSTIQEICNA